MINLLIDIFSCVRIQRKLKKGYEIYMKKTFKKGKKPSIFLRWIFTYIVLSLLVIVASVALYFYSYKVINGQQEKFNTIMQETLEEEIEEYEYIEVFSESDISKEARKIQIFMIFVLFVCLLGGMGIIYVLTLMYYKPLKEIMEAFGYYDSEYDSEEYEWLLNQKDFFYKEHEKAKQELNERENVLRKQDLYRLISLPYDKRYQKYEEFMKDKLFEKEKVLVFLCYTEILDHKAIYMNVSRKLSVLVFENLLEEKLAGRLVVEVVDMTDSYACIVNTDKDSEECREILEEVLGEVQNFLLEELKLQMLFAFGNYQTGISGVHASYIHAREAAEYRGSRTGSQFVWEEDIKHKQSIYQYSAETEHKIINAICVGNNEDACKWLDEVLELNLHEREITHQMKKCLIADMIGTVIKGAEQSGRTQYILSYMDEKPNPERWTEFWDEVMLRKYIHRMVNGVCEDIRNNEKQKRENKEFGRQVMEYVNENYMDPDLNISITALHFGITPSYLSALFKEQTGLNLLEYINHIRVEQAKILLEAGCSLNEVSDRSGFRSSGALIRVFKKETGITPGQMKKILGHTSKE